MSSTNRGYNRHKADYYVTPKEEVEIFLEAFSDKANLQMAHYNYLDPCCGGDKDNGATYVEVLREKYPEAEVCGIDIREDSKADVIMDYLSCEKENMDDHHIIISNPPFYLAEDFIRKSLELIDYGGYVVMLLRLNFFGSKQRKKLFEEFMPKYCFIHHKRINFIPQSMKDEMKANGEKVPSGDSIEYAHFVWEKGGNNDFCKTYVI